MVKVQVHSDKSDIKSEDLLSDFTFYSLVTGPVVKILFGMHYYQRHTRVDILFLRWLSLCERL